MSVNDATRLVRDSASRRSVTSVIIEYFYTMMSLFDDTIIQCHCMMMSHPDHTSVVVSVVV